MLDHAAVASPDGAIARLRGRLRELSPAGGPSALSSVTDDGVAPLRGTLGDLSSTLGLAWPLFRLARAALDRRGRAADGPVPRRPARRGTGPGLLRRHPFDTAAVVLGAGIAAYRLARGQGPGRA